MKNIVPSFEIIRDIRQYFEDANQIFSRKRRYDNDRRDFYARSMVIFAISNRIIDLAREVTSISGYSYPEEKIRNKVFFKRLNDRQVIDFNMRQEMIDLVNFRNRISHHFFEITDDELDKHYKKFPHYKEFVLLMEHEIERKTTEKRILMGLGVAAIILGILTLVWYFS
jgi:uncharacterized protein YutE (UPF0331/DUF86 family)